MPADGLEAAELHGFDAAGSLPEDFGCLFDRKPGDDPQEKDIALIHGETSHDRTDVRVGETSQGMVLPVFDFRGSEEVLIGARFFGMPCLASPLIYETPAGDGEDPGAEFVFAACEAGQVADYLKEHLSKEVLGVVDLVCPEIAKDAGRKLPIEPCPSPVDSNSRGRESRGKV
jgi:hypothetical protein